MRTLPDRRLFLLLLPAALLFPAAATTEPPELPAGELDALRAAVAAELEGLELQRVAIGRFLQTRWDSRRSRGEALDRLSDTLPGATPDLVASFRRRNRDKVELWADARRRLGERSDPNVFLLQRRNEIHVQLARAGWDEAGDRALVYLELRPFEGSEKLRAAFRVVTRVPDGWQVSPERHEFTRGRYRP